MDKGFSQYLQRYAEPETHALHSWPAISHYRAVLVVPAYRESPERLHNLLSSPCLRSDVLVIVVINQPDNASCLQPQQHLFQALLNRGKPLWHSAPLYLIRQIASPPDLLLVDRFSTAVPVKQGVGLARKIGADLALTLIAANHIQTAWIGCTDADAHLPDDYFIQLNQLPPQSVAACYAFTHTGGAAVIERATQQYEQALRYYVAGLRQAGSPYAFLALGSTLVIQAKAYAIVRGFPKRPAGEDFYLLNKLAKIGAIQTIHGNPIRLYPRLSDRVPFGTGVSTGRILQLQQQGQAFYYYHPQVFYKLKQVLIHFPALWALRSNLDRWLDALGPVVGDGLLALGLQRFMSNQPGNLSEQQFNKQLHDWFDALKTLRFIHWLRDHAYPDTVFWSAR